MRTSSRIPEIDCLRVLALMLMILYHLVYDLDFFTSVPVHVNAWAWFLVGKSAALLFIFLAGASSGFSHHPFHNALKLLFWALIITCVTYVMMPNTYVRFGMLHFLGVMAFLYPFLHRRSTFFLILFFFLSLLLGWIFSRTVVSGPWLLPLGIIYSGFSTIDFYPLFPYISVSVLGILFYRLKYAHAPFYGSHALPLLVEKMSRHSLLIYLLHQPVLLSLLFLFQRIRF